MRIVRAFGSAERTHHPPQACLCLHPNLFIPLPFKLRCLLRTPQVQVTILTVCADLCLALLSCPHSSLIGPPRGSTQASPKEHAGTGPVTSSHDVQEALTTEQCGTRMPPCDGISPASSVARRQGKEWVTAHSLLSKKGSVKGRRHDEARTTKTGFMVAALAPCISWGRIPTPHIVQPITHC